MRCINVICRQLRLMATLCLTLLVFGCNSAKEPVPTPVEVQYIVLGEEKVTLSSTLPGRITALVTAEVRPQVDGGPQVEGELGERVLEP